ncbi:MAG: hypothetical protein RDA78_19755 [Roseibium sp.]|uniref:hypothetical protein n=1 Tax=Roseibium sp. TaxID=1936156 RepID=UPI003D9C4C40
MKGAKTILVLRDPVQRFVSNLRHVMMARQLSADDVKERLFANDPVIQGNRITRQLAGKIDPSSGLSLTEQHKMSLLDDITDPIELLEAAYQAIDDAEIVGTSEDMGSVIKQLEFHGIAIKEEKRHVRDGYDLQLNASELDFVREINSLDLEIYNYARVRT